MTTLALLIPAYNAAPYLPRLFETVAAQDGRFDEIWLYDDCSKDDTASVAERYGASVVRGDINRGCTFGKNALVNKTSCEWIHFHDADDLLLPNFLARARSWMDKDDVDVVAFGCEERWGDTNEAIGVSVPVDELLISDPVAFTLNNKINAISGIYRCKAFLAAGGFDLDPEVHYAEDLAGHCSLARAGLRFRGDPAVTVVNLRRRASMWTANQEKCLKAQYHAMLKALAAPGGHRYKDAIAERLWNVAAGSAAFLDWHTADAAAACAMRLSGADAASSSAFFRALCRRSPRFAIRIREWLIRAVKPRYREGLPGWRGSLNVR